MIQTQRRRELAWNTNVSIPLSVSHCHCFTRSETSAYNLHPPVTTAKAPKVNNKTGLMGENKYGAHTPKSRIAADLLKRVENVVHRGRYGWICRRQPAVIRRLKRRAREIKSQYVKRRMDLEIQLTSSLAAYEGSSNEAKTPQGSIDYVSGPRVRRHRSYMPLFLLLRQFPILLRMLVSYVINFVPAVRCILVTSRLFCLGERGFAHQLFNW